MDLSGSLAELRDAVAALDVVVPVGHRTHWEVGGPAPAGGEVRAPAGVVAFDPADLTTTVGAATTVAEIDELLGAAGQECPLDPRSPDATVGGVLAAGLSGPRRLRWGPLRDGVLEIRFVTGDARLVKAGGPTVKNVTGYDLPRVLVGSLGTLGVIGQVTLRARPRPAASAWVLTSLDPQEVLRRCLRPSCVAWDGARCRVLLEGHPADVAAEGAALGGGAHEVGRPHWPDGSHRGRIAVPPSALGALGEALDRCEARWLAEAGVGTVHVAADDPAALLAARSAAHQIGGWMLREAGLPGDDGFGCPMPSAAVTERVRAAFDPAHKLNPGRIPS